MILILVITIFYLINEAEATCLSLPNVIRHNDIGKITNVIEPPSNLAARYWCLSEPFNNSGIDMSWFEQYSVGIWWFNDGLDWNGIFPNGCCSCISTQSLSDTMIGIVEQVRNDGTEAHIGEYIVEVAAIRNNNFYFTRTYNRALAAIPTFHIANYYSTGPGGKTIVTIDGWGTVPGPAHYWVIREDGTEGIDLALDNNCAPNCNSPCPEPIKGYKIMAKAAGSPPTSSNISDWNQTVINSEITPRIPSFPKVIEIANPYNCNANNRYLYIATALLYADGILSNYVSQNSIAIDWCQQNPAEAAPAMQCQKAAGNSITCTYTNGGSCAADNTIYYGQLSSVSNYGYSGAICNIGTSGSASFTLGEGDWFWVIVSNNGSKEGSYGKSSNGVERPEAIGIGNCDYPQDLMNTC